jgi:hypothetical protein
VTGGKLSGICHRLLTWANGENGDTCMENGAAYCSVSGTPERDMFEQARMPARGGRLLPRLSAPSPPMCPPAPAAKTMCPFGRYGRMARWINGIACFVGKPRRLCCEHYKVKGPQMFTWTPDLIQTLVQDGTGIHADVFKRVDAAYPYGVRLWDEDTGATLEVRLCKSLDDAIYSARGATFSQRAKCALSKAAIAAE